MKIHLFLFIGTLALLFSLPPKAKQFTAAPGAEQSSLQSACTKKSLAKRNCPKKCIRHQPHSKPAKGSTPHTDCGQQVYALAHAAQEHKVYFPVFSQAAYVIAPNHYLSPYLKLEPDPPRFS